MSVPTKLQVMLIPEMAQCIQLTWKNIFVIFETFAANFGCCFANFVVISTYDPRNAMQRSQCQACAAPERKNLHFNVAINQLFFIYSFIYIYVAEMTLVVCRLDTSS